MKTIYVRDGANVDGVPKRQPYQMAEISDLPQGGNSQPVEDNDVDASIRSGSAGASADFAREDHKHAIRRQANPGYQTFTVNGPATLVQTINYGFFTEEEAAYQRHRLLIDVNAGNGWVWFNVPTIPGFQRPIVTTLTTYRQTNGNPQQAANQALGNMPDGPFMGSEAAEWTNIPRIYLGPFNHPNAARYFVHIVTKNIRN